jgi:hypothetical protein
LALKASRIASWRDYGAFYEGKGDFTVLNGEKNTGIDRCAFAHGLARYGNRRLDGQEKSCRL